MKGYKALAIACSLVLVVLVSVAAYTGFSSIRIDATSEDTYLIDAYNSSGTQKFDVDTSGNTTIEGTLAVTGAITASGGISSTQTSTIFIPIGGMHIYDGNGAIDITKSTAPGLEMDDSFEALVWADGETTPAIVTFRVPDDYSSGGVFKLFCTESVSTTRNYVDFQVFYNRSNSPIDSAGIDQCPVALAGSGGTTTPSMVTLTPSTDLSGLAAGDWVTFIFWRDDSATYAATGDLEVRGGVVFSYTGTVLP